MGLSYPRDVEVVVITHFGRRGERTPAAVPGEGTESLVQFAAAVGIRLVLSGGYEVLEYRTTAAPVAEIHFPRYQPLIEGDRAEFTRVARRELARLGAEDLVESPDAVNYLFANTLGSLSTLRVWITRVAELAVRLPADYTAEDLLAQAVPRRPGALRVAAQHIVAVEQRLTAEAAVSLSDVFAILAGDADALPGEPRAGTEAPPARPTPNYRDPQTRRPGERALVHDPVGDTDDRVA